ncbi:uncharacterized protein LOC133806207 [Humulus lupulus]|uniref:uncharacterized protein LOC133806207 n=1 Tax=Humulus lupulus TaxID=3486 RepID=UPI002B405021|nr:uncharacterized protein LOC133806207 [Humulus lupulus]
MDSQFPHWDFHTSSIIEGRLLIIWRRLNVKITILEESTQAVHCLVRVMGVQQDFGVTFVYGFNSIEGRRSLWDGLQRPSHLVKSWLYLGDFNSPFSGKDRIGGKPISNTELADSIKWLAGAHVEQLHNIGSYFTWTNNQDGAARIYSKIDHALSNEKWFDLFSQSTAIFRWEGISDHCSCLVRVQNSKKLGSKIFRFYNYWAEHHDFSEPRLKLLAHYNKAKDSYQDAQLQAQAHPHDLCYQEVERIAAGNFSAQQRLACLGSPSLATGRVNIQHIEMGLKLSVEQQVMLLRPFSKKEIREALFSILVTKSPGPDGYGSGFFKAVWSDIGDEVCVAISHCFESGRFPSKLHDTTLSLIPKVANPSRAVDYRPIACCSTLYKCMAKLICKRLAAVLPDIVQTN